MGVRKKAICIISNSREQFLSLRRALRLSFPVAVFYFYDTGIVKKGQLGAVESPRHKKAGILIALFSHHDENLRIVCLIKYLRIMRKLQFPLIYISTSSISHVKGRYSILRYGAKSHLYCQLPVKLPDFIKAISASKYMSNENHDLFCREFSGNHKQFYEETVLSLVSKAKNIVANKNRKRWGNLINKLYQLEGYLSHETPVTWYGKISFGGRDEILATLIHSEIEKIAQFDRLPEARDPLLKNVDSLSILLNRWYDLVEKNFE